MKYVQNVKVYKLFGFVPLWKVEHVDILNQ